MQHITVDELKAKMNAGENLHIIDVREPHEYAEFNIGAMLLPLGKIQSMQIEEIEDWKDAEVIVHCRSGVRSQSACLVLDQLGFKNTKNLTGGVLAWIEKFGR
jgi:rhodanese-related sulfurtransferase